MIKLDSLEFVFVLDIRMSVTHCIFDLDGLLLDTESIYTECLQQICAPYGKNFSTETKLEIMGKSSLEAGQILIRMLEFLNEKKSNIFFRRTGFTDK
jgi:beta-phosphoglucomutase-like phosphatase (HAD superfamily)